MKTYIKMRIDCAVKRVREIITADVTDAQVPVIADVLEAYARRDGFSYDYWNELITEERDWAREMAQRNKITRNKITHDHALCIVETTKDLEQWDVIREAVSEIARECIDNSHNAGLTYDHWCGVICEALHADMRNVVIRD